MNETTCPDFAISDRLVEYADGELSAAEAALVKKHLTHCAVCRREVGALEVTLDLAHLQWLETPVPSLDSAARRIRGLYLGTALRFAAATLLIAAFGGAAWWVLRPQGQVIPVAVGTNKNVSTAELSRADVSPQELAAIEMDVNSEAAAARLVASAEVLAGQPGAEKFAERSFRYVVEVFPNTAASAMAAARLANDYPTHPTTQSN